MKPENNRLKEQKSGKKNWGKWGPYLTERQWGTVREDYSPHGTAWEHTSHDMARSKAYRWGEEGIGGISDEKQLLCFSVGLWNKKDPIIKERLFGLTGNEGNHGEDVKEYYYYLDSTPTHSYMKMLYKYPHQAFPYEQLLHENRNRGKHQPEFELIDTGIFDENNYFDVFLEYAKEDVNDLLIQITIHNRSEKEKGVLNVLPQIWFRNTWSWGYDDYKPALSSKKKGEVKINHRDLKPMTLYCQDSPEILFCENESNNTKLYGDRHQENAYYKDGINDYLIHGALDSVNRVGNVTKAAANYDVTIAPNKALVLKLRLTDQKLKDPFSDFSVIFESRKKEADEFYSDLQKGIAGADEKSIQRQALAGML